MIAMPISPNRTPSAIGTADLEREGCFDVAKEGFATTRDTVDVAEGSVYLEG